MRVLITAHHPLDDAQKLDTVVEEIHRDITNTGSAGKKEYVRCETRSWSSRVTDFVPGAFTIEMHRDWAPIGYARFMELVKDDFFTDQLIYRTIPGFLVQFDQTSCGIIHLL